MRPLVVRVKSRNPFAFRMPSGEIKYKGDYEDIAKYLRDQVVDHIDCRSSADQIFLYTAIRSLADNEQFQAAVTGWMEKLVAQASAHHADPSLKVKVLEELKINPCQGVISLADNLIHMWV